jgi:hypothetical protein
LAPAEIIGDGWGRDIAMELGAVMPEEGGDNRGGGREAAELSCTCLLRLGLLARVQHYGKDVRFCLYFFRLV